MFEQKVFTINSGSSSLKFSLYLNQHMEPIVSGIAECLNSEHAEIHWVVKLPEQDPKHCSHKIAGAAHAQVLSFLLNELQAENLIEGLTAVGHRVVHGGEFFSEPALINDDVMDKINRCLDLAPLHNPAHILGIEAIQQLLPEVPQVAVFDTAFHQTMPKYAYLYALPYQYYKDYGVRKYGFHGTSHQYVAEKAVNLLQLNPANSAIITAHLGNGCSIAAVKNGQSVDTSMGFTPLEGLMMGTRSGDIDPSIVNFLSEKLQRSSKEIIRILNNSSGLLGVSGQSNDMRYIQSLAKAGDFRASMAVEMFCYRLAKYIASFFVCFDRLDALVFTGGIGENDRNIRSKVMAHLTALGLKIDKSLNETHGDELGIISKKLKNRPLAMVVKTDEEIMIAKAALTYSQTQQERPDA